MKKEEHLPIFGIGPFLVAGMAIIAPCRYRSILMTVVLKNTEEKWLRDLYGQEYEDYCKRVNRCVPFKRG